VRNSIDFNKISRWFVVKQIKLPVALARGETSLSPASLGMEMAALVIGGEGHDRPFP
jgi:hypothetical protein